MMLNIVKQRIKNMEKLKQFETWLDNSIYGDIVGLGLVVGIFAMLFTLLAIFG